MNSACLAHGVSSSLSTGRTSRWFCFPAKSGGRLESREFDSRQMLPFCVQELSLWRLHSPCGCRGTAQGLISRGSDVGRSTFGWCRHETASWIALILVSLVITKPRDEPLLEEPFCCDWWRKQANGGAREKRLNWTKGLDRNLKNASVISPCFTLNKTLISLIWHWLTSNKMSFLIAWFPSAWRLSPCTPAGPWQSRAEQNRPLCLCSPGSQLWLPEWQLLSARLLCTHGHSPSTTQWAGLQLRQSTDATHLFHHWLQGGTSFLLFSLQVSILILFPQWTSLPRWSFTWSEWLLRLFGISELLRQCVGVHLVSACFLQGSGYDLPPHVLTAFTFLFSRIHF